MHQSTFEAWHQELKQVASASVGVHPSSPCLDLRGQGANQYDSLLHNRPPRFPLATDQLRQLVHGDFEQIDRIAGDPGGPVGPLAERCRPSSVIYLCFGRRHGEHVDVAVLVCFTTGEGTEHYETRRGRPDLPRLPRQPRQHPALEICQHEHCPCRLIVSDQTDETSGSHVPALHEPQAHEAVHVQLDRTGRLRLVADTYGLDAEGRSELVRHLDRPMRGGGAFVQRRVDAGDPNFIRMLKKMGGMERYNRRLRWWEENRESFVRALA